MSAEPVTAGSVEQLGRQQPFPRPEEVSGLRERQKVATRQALGKAAIWRFRLSIGGPVEPVFLSEEFQP